MRGKRQPHEARLRPQEAINNNIEPHIINTLFVDVRHHASITRVFKCVRCGRLYKRGLTMLSLTFCPTCRYDDVKDSYPGCFGECEDQYFGKCIECEYIHECNRHTISGVE